MLWVGLIEGYECVRVKMRAGCVLGRVFGGSEKEVNRRLF